MYSAVSCVSASVKFVLLERQVAAEYHQNLEGI
jgi:hypothetical protein